VIVGLQAGLVEHSRGSEGPDTSSRWTRTAMARRQAGLLCRGERSAPVRFLQFDGDDEYVASMVVGTMLTHPASRELMFCSHPCSKELSWDSRPARVPRGAAAKRAFGSWMTTARFQGRSRPDPRLRVSMTARCPEDPCPRPARDNAADLARIGHSM
jgi:hypothetical protein